MIPEVLKQRVLQSVHSAWHQGIDGMMSILKVRFFWVEIMYWYFVSIVIMQYGQIRFCTTTIKVRESTLVMLGERKSKIFYLMNLCCHSGSDNVRMVI